MAHLAFLFIADGVCPLPSLPWNSVCPVSSLSERLPSQKADAHSRPPSWRGYHHRNSSGCPDVAQLIPAPLQSRYLLQPGKRLLRQPCCPRVAPTVTVWSSDAIVISLLQVGTVVRTEGQEPSALFLGPGLSSRPGRPDLEITC